MIFETYYDPLTGDYGFSGLLDGTSLKGVALNKEERELLLKEKTTVSELLESLVMVAKRIEEQERLRRH